MKLSLIFNFQRLFCFQVVEKIHKQKKTKTKKPWQYFNVRYLNSNRITSIQNTTLIHSQTFQALYKENFHVVNIYSIITSKFCASQSTKSAVLKYFLLCLISGTESLSINLKKKIMMEIKFYSQVTASADTCLFCTSRDSMFENCWTTNMWSCRLKVFINRKLFLDKLWKKSAIFTLVSRLCQLWRSISLC